MIRYRVTQADLLRAVDEIAPTWRDRATRRTDACRTATMYVDPPSGIWSEIKRVFMDLQQFKCGFCERKLEQSDFGNVEHDVEHYRPKGEVSVWPPASAPERGEGLNLPLGGATRPGYFLLAHNPENYLISCKTCNTALKGNGFPVEGARAVAIENPRHGDEQPCLPYPIGSFDDDPERLIRFEGIVPVPAARSGRRRRRGQVLINFFQLHERDGLLEERSIVIMALHLAMVSVDHPDALTRSLARQYVGRLTSDAAAHANCARSFRDLWMTNRGDAEVFSQLALDHIASLA